MIFFAKIFTYDLNAYLDAQIAEEIVVYIKSGGKTFATKNTIAQQRAEKLVASVSKGTLQTDPSFLIGLAYTEYYLNGLADVLYAKLFWSFYISPQKSHLYELYMASITRFRKQLPTEFQYEEIVRYTGITLWYWPVVVANPWRWANHFAKERCGYEGKLDKNALRKASIEVQHQNIQNNHGVAQALLHNTESSDPKVLAARDLASKVHNTSAFLSEVAATQAAAAKWDKLFVWLIKR